MIGKARTIVACVVALIGAAAIAVPVGTYFNTARAVQYQQVSSNTAVEYGEPLPSPPSHGEDYTVRVLSNDYKLYTEVGAKNIKVVYIFEPKPGKNVPRLRHVVNIEIVKGKAVPFLLEATESFKAGGTAHPFKTEEELPKPPKGFKRPWVVPKVPASSASTELPTFIFLTTGKPLTATTLKNLSSGQFTATYEALVDTDHYEGDKPSQYVITYNIV